MAAFLVGRSHQVFCSKMVMKNVSKSIKTSGFTLGSPQDPNTGMPMQGGGFKLAKR